MILDSTRKHKQKEESEMAVPVRGLHLYPSRWNDPYGAKFASDRDKINAIGNLNSVKITLFSYMNHYEQGPIPSYALYTELRGGPTGMRTRQEQKISTIRQISGLPGNATYLFRCWPEEGVKQPWDQMYDPGAPGDFVQIMTGEIDYYESGRQFAHNLLQPLTVIQNLGIPYVLLEVANEPNHPNEPFGQSMAHYNDFFRGFYYGQQEINFSYPLVYAGLSGDNPSAWYQDYWVQYHIREFASKVGVHCYWNNGKLESEDPDGGRYYRWVKRTLQAAGVGPKGIQVTEFNIARDLVNNDAMAQIYQCRDWWRGFYNDALSGYWCEQGYIFVSNADPDWSLPDPYYYINCFQITDSQLPIIRDA